MPQVGATNTLPEATDATVCTLYKNKTIGTEELQSHSELGHAKVFLFVIVVVVYF